MFLVVGVVFIILAASVSEDDPRKRALSSLQYCCTYLKVIDFRGTIRNLTLNANICVSLSKNNEISYRYSSNGIPPQFSSCLSAIY